MDIILVDENDSQIGTSEKIETHKKGFLHRAFSVFVFNSKGQLLIQKRAHTKYHSPGLWSNTCCSHPRPEKNIDEEALNRLSFEMGIQCKLDEKFSFIYKIEFENGLIENEFDHVFFGISNEDPKPDPKEVSDWRWIGLDELKMDLKKNKKDYSHWLNTCLPKIMKIKKDDQ